MPKALVDVHGPTLPYNNCVHQDVAIERASRTAEAAADAVQVERSPAEGADSVGATRRASEAEAGAPELIGLQPLCEMGVNAGMYLGHGHSVAAGAER